MNYFKKKSNFSLFGLAVIGLIFLIRCSSETAQDKILSSVTISFSISGKGLVSQESGIYELNSSITIIATPEQGYYFDRWEGFEQIVEAQEYSFIPSEGLLSEIAYQSACFSRLIPKEVTTTSSSSFPGCKLAL
jgi:hypothetical protein